MLNAEEIIKKWIKENESKITALSDRIWNIAEVAYEEYESSKLLINEFKKEGFKVQEGVAGIPTAFTAEWSNGGGHRVGFIGEYDAVPGMAYKVSTKKEPENPEGPGHACGHNLLGVGSMAACFAAKQAMEQLGIKGILKYFGCPAEEGGAAKVFMVREGVFEGLDALVRWHPANTNWVSMANSLAMNSVKFNFHGIPSHAGINPHLGRSALDAAILMDVGVNYLREHMTDDIRIHSVITNGGRVPNIVPAEAQIWYYIRGPKGADVEKVYKRMVKIAEGAALMTETTMDQEFISGSHETLPNSVLSEVMYDSFIKMGAPDFNEEEKKFAAQITEGISRADKRSSLRKFAIDENVGDNDLHWEVAPIKDANRIMPISTDSADVSWQTPMAQMFTCCQPIGTANHSWQQTVCAGMSIGHKGMLAAARTLALTSVRIIDDDDTLRKAKEEFMDAIKDNPYKCPLPEGLMPKVKNK